ncbi:protein kinase [Dokdonella sp.]|uniref:serine/threonine-protein kinase n=1 Tax=Dokdonella sp. TaxID=2291710 RepID=UPI0035279541
MIEIPGYRLLRQLGRGGMATVYLAVQESVDREVALKIMSPALLVDPNFGERFLREAKIAARLHHRHVVGIHDVSRVGDYHYIAMEYLAGGPVLSKDGPARPVSFALRVTREIAGAINYAQQKGFIHRDIKPDNILLRDDESSVLTDFGIARANDSATRMTRTGAVVGTPHYMSPEQARGKQLDGRADLYSLGVVLYEMLVGRVPYHAEDSLAVGIMHITQPVPKLPDSLSVLQPLVDGLLAKEPHDRFQTGNDAALAIARYEQAIASGELEGLESLTSGERSESHSAETRVSPLPLTQHSPRPDSADAGGRNRADPSMGRLEEIMAATDDHIMRARRSSARRATPKKRRTGLWVTLLVLLLAMGSGAALVWKNQDWLRALLPNTELNDILARAQRAQDAGELDGNQGSSARELFERARALDLDNEIARRGLRSVGEKLLARARDALARNDPDTARKSVAAARELLGGGISVDEVDQAIAALDARSTETEALLDSAQQALDAGRILGEDGAVALYQRMLVADPGNSLATAGISRSAKILSDQAAAAFEARELETASARIEDIARILPAFPGLPELRAQLASQLESAAQDIDKDLTRGESQLRAGRYAGNADSAQALFESVLQRDPDNARARAGLRRVAQALVAQARAAIEDSNPGNADKLLKQAAAIAPETADLRSARIELRELRERLAIAAERPPPSAAEIQRVQTLIADAASAVRAGRLINPPGNSAYDKYRAALAIDGNNQDALIGLNQLPVRARQLFDEYLGEGSLARALGMLEVVRQVSPADSTLASMSALLASAYLDQAEKQMARSELEDARRSLKTARDLSPNHPRLGTIEQQLRGQSTPAN